MLMHMQLSLRASLLSTAVPAKIKLGFDRSRAREMQWLFTNSRIAPAARQHVMDSLFGFAEKFDVYDKLLRWDIPLPDQRSRLCAAASFPQPGNTLIISPCSSHRLRNWRPEYYAEVADYAIASLGMRVFLCGGPSEHRAAHRRGDRQPHEAGLREHHRPGHAVAVPGDAGTGDGADHARFGAGAHGDDRRHSR